MRNLPEAVRAYSRSPTFDENSVPDALRKNHQTKAGVWGVINVLSGKLKYRIAEPESETVLSPDVRGIIEPEALHSVEPLGPVSFYVEFCR